MAASAMVFFGARLSRAECKDEVVKAWWGTDSLRSDGSWEADNIYICNPVIDYAHAWSDDSNFASVPSDPSEEEIAKIREDVAEIAVSEEAAARASYGWWLSCSR